ncbi:MAG: tRNA (adenosine(37)-N6)-threonylcarbamoyltransferase complex dimerization subunit type 1 TsaB [Planctomycetaceae bacterium]|jgi:tRNA threonylcarbamoyladenosine biosynthesis protein TsaB|nr:tRNA (adenosine(37)-N6)-threonylcarbamoyltransferase complex dimerization subunit type 1 TsaB [Planctomycetaceae bacterium]
MNILLALETTEKYGSVAILTGKDILAETQLPHEWRSSRTLAPAINSLFRETNIVPNNITVVAVVVGPGSFTGLRVGVTTAKIFAYAVGAEMVGVSTFDTIAEMCSHFSNDYLSIGVDAQRSEAVTALFKKTETGYKAVSQPKLIRVTDWWEQTEHLENVVLTGPALERWGGKAPKNVLLANEQFWFPKASAAGIIAAEQIDRQKITENCWSLQPVYSRLSAAEEKNNSAILQQPFDLNRKD